MVIGLLNVEPQSLKKKKTHPKARFAGVEFTASGNVRAAHSHDTSQYVSRGWIFPAEQIFDQAQLEALFDVWRSDAKILRAKGVFRVGRDWRLCNLVGTEVNSQSLAYRRDSRVELIVRAKPAPDWGAIEIAIKALPPPNHAHTEALIVVERAPITYS